ncbi:MAG: hypothetical protein MI922_23290 [Bacteroidales bacterium]|nr:hypothetical protein [Bacteroidales bacterium]
MKKNLLLSTILTLTLTFTLNAQSILDETFNGLTELPSGINAFSNGNHQISVENDMITFPSISNSANSSDSAYGINCSVENIADSVTFAIKLKTANAWTQRSQFNFKNAIGDTIGQMAAYGASGGNGHFLVTEAIPSNGTFEYGKDARSVKNFGPFQVKPDKVSLDYTFIITINILNKTISIIQDIDTAKTALYAEPGKKITMEIVGIHHNKNIYIDSLAIYGSGDLVGSVNSIPNSEINETNCFVTSFVNSNTNVLPTINNSLKNYSFKIYNLTGHKVFETSNPHVGWATKSAGLYIYSVSGMTLNGKQYNKSGKIIVQ